MSTAVTSEFVKMTDDKDIKLIYPPANPYSSGGATNLIDDTIFTGFQNWRMVSFEKVNLEAIMDLRVDKSSTTLANRLPKQ